MQYQELLSRTLGLPFLHDSDSAESAIESITRMLASHLDDAHCALLRRHLPESLSAALSASEELEPIAAGAGLAHLQRQLKLERRQTEELIRTVLDGLTHDADAETLGALREGLPADWNHLLTLH